MTDILDTLKAAVANKDGTDPVELSAEDVYEIIGEMRYLRRQHEGLIERLEGVALHLADSRPITAREELKDTIRLYAPRS